MCRLAIADPPYPPIRAAHPRNDKPRASFWYGDSLPSCKGAPRADNHPDASEWDAPERHQRLMAELDAEFDGWAIATAHDSLPVYGTLPRGARVMIWHKPNSIGTASRIRNVWEPVIIKPPASRLSSKLMGGSINDLLTASAPRRNFAGSKPDAWTRWVLDALGYDPATDDLVDMFPGSGSVAAAASQGALDLYVRDGGDR